MENLNEALTALITQATSGIDTSIGFLQTELPEVITQLLMWHGVKSGILSLVGIITVIASVFFTKKIYIKVVEEDQFGDHPELMFLVFMAVPVAAGFGAINLTWLQIWIAPKVWLIEYAAGLVK